MNTTKFKHHNLTKNEVMLVVPNSLQWNKTTFDIIDDMTEHGLTVIPVLNFDPEHPSIECEEKWSVSMVVNPDTETEKRFSIIINEETDDLMRDMIRYLISGKFDEIVKFDLLIEEKWGRTFINEIIPFSDDLFS